MRKVLILLLVLLCSFSLIAGKSINEEEISEIVKAYISSIGASYIALSQVELPGVAIKKSDSFIPDSVSLNDADLYSFKFPLSRKSFMPLSVSRPFAEKAIKAIDELKAREGAYMADGVVDITKKSDIALFDILSSRLSSIDISATFDVVLYGTMLDEKIDIRGTMKAKGNDNGEVEIRFPYLNVGGHDILIQTIVSKLSF